MNATITNRGAEFAPRRRRRGVLGFAGAVVLVASLGAASAAVLTVNEVESEFAISNCLFKVEGTDSELVGGVDSGQGYYINFDAQASETDPDTGAVVLQEKLDVRVPAGHRTVAYDVFRLEASNCGTDFNVRLKADTVQNLLGENTIDGNWADKGVEMYVSEQKPSIVVSNFSDPSWEQSPLLVQSGQQPGEAAANGLTGQALLEDNSQLSVGFDFISDAVANTAVNGIFRFQVVLEPTGTVVAATTETTVPAATTTTTIPAAPQTFALSSGGTGSDIARSVAVDEAGNTTIAGYYNGTADFDPGPGVTNLTPAGSTDVFFAKYDPNGNLVWAKSVGGTSHDFSNSVAIDSEGNTTIAGRYSGTADFDPGPGVTNLTSAGSYDVFFAKYDPNGNLVWAKSVGGTGIDLSNSVAVDAAGNSTITGYYGGTADFDPGPGVTNLTSAGSNDVFVARYDSNGNLVWAKSVGGTGNDLSNSVAVDAAGNSTITGYYGGTADFDPGPGVTNLTSAAGSSDVFFAKYDSNGNLVWAKSVGGTGNDLSNSVAVDAAGNSTITGYYDGTADFDPGPGVTNLTPAGGNDAFFAKYDPNGNLVWAKSVGGTGNDLSNSVAVDAAGNSTIAGYYNGTADFDPGPGVTNLTSAGGNDAFFARYDPNGNLVWATSVGSTGSDIALSVAVDAAGNSTIAGYYNGTADFDPGPGVTNRTSAGGNDVFVARYDSNGNLS